MAQRIAKPVAIDLFAGAGVKPSDSNWLATRSVSRSSRTRTPRQLYRHNRPGTTLFRTTSGGELDPAKCLRECNLSRSGHRRRDLWASLPRLLGIEPADQKPEQSSQPSLHRVPAVRHRHSAAMRGGRKQSRA